MKRLVMMLVMRTFVFISLLLLLLINPGEYLYCEDQHNSTSPAQSVASGTTI